MVTKTSSTSDTTSTDTDDTDDTKDDEEYLKKTITSGYTNEELNSILSKVVKTQQQSAKTLRRTLELQNANPKYYFMVNGQPLAIKTGFTADRDIKVGETRLFSGFDTNANAAAKHLYFMGDAGLTLELSALIRTDQKYKGSKVGSIDYTNKTVFSVLSDWSRLFQLCEIESQSTIIENGRYRLTKLNPTQLTHGLIQCDLTFVQDTYNYEASLQTEQDVSEPDSNVITDTSDTDITFGTVSGGSIDTTSTVSSKLTKCGLLSQKCSCRNRREPGCSTKYVACAYVLQEALQHVGFYINGRLDGLYCYYTYQSVYAFQRKYKSKYNLTPTGIFDTKTKNALLKLL